MKILTSQPTDKEFYDTYAPLLKKIDSAGKFSQVVSGLTEVGIIFTGTYQSMKALNLGFLAFVIAIIVAIIATATIEIGLRHVFPKAVDSILFKRWSGLHALMSIFVCLLAFVLLSTSGLLSFKNSSVIVEDLTPETKHETSFAADSLFQLEKSNYTAAFRQDSAMVETTYQSRMTASIVSFDAKIKSKREKIRGYESREARTGNSYSSRKDRVRQDIANLEASKADSVAVMEMNKANELMVLKNVSQSNISRIDTVHQKAVGNVIAKNNQSEIDREDKINKYGGGLGWFTIVCLFIFAVSVILDRIYKKGAGITESIQIGSYDFRPSAWTEWWAARMERINFYFHNKIKQFADQTPPAPLPAQPGTVYDLVEALQHLTVKLELEKEQDNNTIYLKRKMPEVEPPPPEKETPRKTIGYSRKEDVKDSCDLYSPPTTKEKTTKPPIFPDHETTKHEAKKYHETPDLRSAKQALKKYKKRLGSHQQKAIKQEKSDKGMVCKRTAEAIKNNESWVNHWTNEINRLSK